VQFSKPVGKIQGLFKHFQRPCLFSSTFKGIAFFKLNSSTFKDYSSMLRTLLNSGWSKGMKPSFKRPSVL